MICILSYVDDNDDDYVKYTLQLSWFTLPETRPEPDPEPGLLTITRPEVKKCYLSCPALNTEFWPLSFIGRGWLEEGNLYQQQSPNLSPKSWQCKSLFVIHVFLDMFLDAAFRGGHLNILLWTFVQKYTELRKPSFTNCAVFLSSFKGGVKPMLKIMLQIYYYSKGLFANIKLTWKTF